MSDPEFLAHVRGVGAYLGEGLQDLAERYEAIDYVRGRGLIWGLQLDREALPYVNAGYEKGLLTLSAGPQVLRLLPPLIINKPDIDKGLEILDGIFAEN